MTKMTIVNVASSYKTMIEEDCAMIVCEFNADGHHPVIMLAKNLWRILMHDYE